MYRNHSLSLLLLLLLFLSLYVCVWQLCAEINLCAFIENWISNKYSRVHTCCSYDWVFSPCVLFSLLFSLSLFRLRFLLLLLLFPLSLPFEVLKWLFRFFHTQVDQQYSEERTRGSEREGERVDRMGNSKWETENGKRETGNGRVSQCNWLSCSFNWFSFQFLS